MALPATSKFRALLACHPSCVLSDGHSISLQANSIGPHASLCTHEWHFLQFLAWDQESRNKMTPQHKGGSRHSENAIVAHEFKYLVSKQAWPCAVSEQGVVFSEYAYSPHIPSRQSKLSTLCRSYTSKMASEYHQHRCAPLPSEMIGHKPPLGTIDIGQWACRFLIMLHLGLWHFAWIGTTSP